MKLLRPNDHEITQDFPDLGHDRVSRYLRWQECIITGHYVANICFEAVSHSASGSNEELLERAASLICGQNFTEEEVRWVMGFSSVQLGW